VALLLLLLLPCCCHHVGLPDCTAIVASCLSRLCYEYRYSAAPAMLLPQQSKTYALLPLTM
jgi:hypothetical protein